MGVPVNVDGDVNTKGKKLLVSYLVEKKHQELESILRSVDLEGRKVHLVHIHSQELMDISPILFSQCMSDPEKWTLILDKLLAVALDQVYDEVSSKERNVFTKKETVHLRLASLPADPWFQRTSFPKVEQVGHMVQLVGTVTKTVQRNTLVWRKNVKCTKCRFTFPMVGDYEQFYSVPLSGVLCPNPEGCQGTQFTVLNKPTDETDRCNVKDYQEIRIQEQVYNLSLGTTPRRLWVTLEDDLVDTVKPGDDVEVIGIVKQRWKPFQKEENTEIEIVLKTHHISVQNSHAGNLIKAEEAEEEFNTYWARRENMDVIGRNKILESICPKLFGLYVAKLALAVVLAGGVEKVDRDGTRMRGESHLLMVGDPGTGKSQLLRFASRVKARSVMISGANTSAAGLTVSASSEGGEWHLEAGALVLADGGICCIDEFSDLSNSDRACLHEAMEQQIISVAKAGMLSKLHTRCSVLAATNPKGEFDPRLDLTDNTGIASPLLSRFDVVLVLVDTRSPDWDWQIGDLVLSEKEEDRERPEPSRSFWSTARLETYFSHVKKYRPQLGPGASQVLNRFYLRKRECEEAEASRITLRLLQSSIRLAQGHARLLARSEVTTQDAVVAVVILEASNESWNSLIQGCNLIHSDFPPDPLEEYRNQAEAVLTGLGLQELWKEEVARLDMLLAREQEPVHSPSSQTGTRTRPATTDFTQVVREIQRNRAVTLPPPECGRKRKRRQAKIGRKADKRVTEREDCGDLSSGDDSADEDDFNPVFQSTQINTSSEVSQIQGDSSTSLGDPSNASESDVKLSNKTVAKLAKFRRIERENDTTEDSSENLSTEVKSNLAQLLAVAGNLVENSEKEVRKPETNDKKFPWEESEDLEVFDFDT